MCVDVRTYTCTCPYIFVGEDNTCMLKFKMWYFLLSIAMQSPQHHSNEDLRAIDLEMNITTLDNEVKKADDYSQRTEAVRRHPVEVLL